jgi:hypothetical protein
MQRAVCTKEEKEENEMNADQLKGRWMQFKGELKEPKSGMGTRRVS